VDQGRSTAITYSEDGFVVEAELVAEKLGLSPHTFWQEMNRGSVYGVVERGEGDDAGRTRLTFRYRARSWSITTEVGSVEEPNASE
jgi:predicted ArsR family transcriptional regulator